MPQKCTPFHTGAVKLPPKRAVGWQWVGHVVNHNWQLKTRHLASKRQNCTHAAKTCNAKQTCKQTRVHLSKHSSPYHGRRSTPRD